MMLDSTTVDTEYLHLFMKLVLGSRCAMLAVRLCLCFGFGIIISHER